MLASAPDPEETQDKTLPEMRIVESEILIGNEVENSNLQIADADILVAPHTLGVRRKFELAIETASEPVHLSAEGLYRAADQRIELQVDFADLALNCLGALIPGPVPGEIMREPVSGSVHSKMDKFFSIDAAQLDLTGDAIKLAGQARLEPKLVSLKVRSSLTDSSLRALSGGWPTGLGPKFETWLAARHDDSEEVAIAFEGDIHRFDQSLRLTGTLGTPETPFIVSGIAGKPVMEIPAQF